MKIKDIKDIQFLSVHDYINQLIKNNEQQSNCYHLVWKISVKHRVALIAELQPQQCSHSVYVMPPN